MIFIASFVNTTVFPAQAIPEDQTKNFQKKQGKAPTHVIPSLKKVKNGM
jgi:hypothetical protein